MLGEKNINLDRITASSPRFNMFSLSHAWNFTVAPIQSGLATQNHNSILLTMQTLQLKCILSYYMKVTTLYIASASAIQETLFGCEEKYKLRLWN